MDINKATIKDLITSELSNFLLRENIKPEVIKIEVHYKHSLARLTIDEDKIRSFAEKALAERSNR